MPAVSAVAPRIFNLGFTPNFTSCGLSARANIKMSTFKTREFHSPVEQVRNMLRKSTSKFYENSDSRTLSAE